MAGFSHRDRVLVGRSFHFGTILTAAGQCPSMTSRLRRLGGADHLRGGPHHFGSGWFFAFRCSHSPRNRRPMDPRLWLHLPISFCVALYRDHNTLFFRVEWRVTGVCFRYFSGARADLTNGAVTSFEGVPGGQYPSDCPIFPCSAPFAPVLRGDPRWFAFRRRVDLSSGSARS